MSEHVENAKRYHMTIREILMAEWDPIGVAHVPEASDEYDAYVVGVYKLLIRRAPSFEVLDYLWEIETEHMGLAGDRQRTTAVAERLSLLPQSMAT